MQVKEERYHAANKPSEGGERLTGRMDLMRVAGLAAAGHPASDEEDVDVGPMFESDVDIELDTPKGGVWSFGPPKA